jgi:poly(3-hydroxyalkanoate) synthetase
MPIVSSAYSKILHSYLPLFYEIHKFTEIVKKVRQLFSHPAMISTSSIHTSLKKEHQNCCILEHSLMNEVFQMLKENNFNPRLLYPAKQAFIIEGEIQTFHDKWKLKQLMTTKSSLQKTFKEILHTEH